MFGSIVASALLQAAAPASPVTVQNVQGWQIAGSQEGCVAHAAYQGGTVLSVFALPEQDGIAFLLQNRSWAALRDGAVYLLDIRFDDGSVWQIPAVARSEIDDDGPGLFFAVRPGSEESGRDFMVEFADAGRMQVSNSGVTLDRLTLAGSRPATVALAQCLSRVLNGGGSGNPLGEGESARTAIRI